MRKCIRPSPLYRTKKRRKAGRGTGNEATTLHGGSHTQRERKTLQWFCVIQRRKAGRGTGNEATTLHGGSHTQRERKTLQWFCVIQRRKAGRGTRYEASRVANEETRNSNRITVFNVTTHVHLMC